jgi:hypothetical protein
MQSVVTFVRRRPAVLAAAGLAILLVLLFPRIVLEGRIFFDRDIYLFRWTQMQSFVRVVTSAAWPLWDPYVSFGQPLLADPGAEILYPPTWLHLLASAGSVTRIFVLAHLLFGALGLRALARALGVSEASAFLGASVWMLSGPTVSLANNFHHLAGAAWLPWVLWAVESACVSRRRHSGLVLAFVAAGQVLAGSPDMCTMSAMAAVAITAGHALGPSRIPFFSLVRRTLPPALLAAAITCLLWLPALEVTARSSRADLPEAMRTYWSVSPFQLSTAVLPVRLTDLPLRPAFRKQVAEGRDPFLMSIYLGLTGLGLAILAWCGRRRRLAWFLGAMFALTALGALGRFTPLYDALTWVILPLRVLRYPEKLMVLAAVPWALLAALGLDSLPTPMSQSGKRLSLFVWGTLEVATWAIIALVTWGRWWPGGPSVTWLATGPGAALLHRAAVADLVAPAALLMAAGVACLLPARSGRTLIAVVAVADLLIAHTGLQPAGHPAMLRERPAVLASIDLSDHSRVHVWEYARVRGRAVRLLGTPRPYWPRQVPKGWTTREAWALAARQALQPPTAAGWGLATSFDLDYKGLLPAPLARLERSFEEAQSTMAATRLLQLGAVSHVVTLHSAVPPGLQLEAVVPALTRRPVLVWRVPRPLPRVFAVSGARVAADDEAIGLLASGALDPRREVALPEGAPRAPLSGFRAETRITEMSPDRVRVETRLSDDGFVVAVDTYDPGWRTSVDGRPVRLLRANVAFRAVPVPAGNHVVEMSYRPPTVAWGLGISILGLLLAAALTLRLRSR